MEPVPKLEQNGLSAAITQQLVDYFDTLGGDAPAPGLYKRVLYEIEKPLIVAVLDYTHGNNARAAEILGINRNTLRKKMLELGVSLKKR